MNRKFLITLEIVDNEAPTETPEESCVVLKQYLTDAMLDLAFDIQKLEVTSV